MRTTTSTAGSWAWPTSSGARSGCARPTRTCSATSAAGASSRSAVARRCAHAGWPPRAVHRSRSTCPPGCSATPGPALAATGIEVPLDPGRRGPPAAAVRGVRHRVHGLRCGAVRRRQRRVMREVARVLRPGGRWVFATTHPTRWSFPDDPGPAGLTATMPYWDDTPYVEYAADATPTYVEHHRTLGRTRAGDRRRGFPPARHRRAAVAGRRTRRNGASGRRCAARSCRDGDLRLRAGDRPTLSADLRPSTSRFRRCRASDRPLALGRFRRRTRVGIRGHVIAATVRPPAVCGCARTTRCRCRTRRRRRQAQ